jgi:ABC-2 type transport system permease protein
MNVRAVAAIYRFEMARWFRTLAQSIATPVLSTALYFLVFGAAIGPRMSTIDGIPYGVFLVPGLTLLPVLTESVSNASFGIYMPRFSGTIFEVLSAPLTPFEMMLGYVGAATTKSVLLGGLILGTARIFVPYSIAHPALMLLFLGLTAVTFSLLGFGVGLWADGWEKLQIVPALVITPLGFLGGSFYSISMLPPTLQKIALLNPVVYLMSGFRRSFYGHGDVSLGTSLIFLLGFGLLGLAGVLALLRTGYRIRP